MFDVKKHLIQLGGNRLYLPVASRLVWFRQEHPDWGIDTKPIIIDIEKQFAVFEASVYDADGKLMAKGTKMETVQGFPDYVEKSETGAIGRALAVCGFGTQFAPDLEELARSHQVDAPVAGDGPRYQRSGNGNGDRPTATARPTERARFEPANGNSHESTVPGSGGADSDIAGERGCAVCGRELTKGQELLSLRKFGLGLCPDCQKERRTAAASEEAAAV